MYLFPYDLAEGILGKLGSVQEMGLLLHWGVKSELEKLTELTDTVSNMRDVLPDAEEKSFTSRGVEYWLTDLIDVMHDAEELMDVFLARSLLWRRRRGNKFAKEVSLFFSTWKMAPRLRDLRARLHGIVSRGTAEFQLCVIPRPSPMEEISLPMEEDEDQLTRSYPDEIIVGREADKEAILEALFSEEEEDKSVETVTIVGMDGMGKTVLARMVYEDEVVARQFGLRLWVDVRRYLDVPQIVEEIVKQFTHESLIGGIDTNSLEAILRATVKANRFLLVLDDVLDLGSQLIDLFEDSARGSKILLTSPYFGVGRIGSREYMLDRLSYDASLSLFKQTAFQGRPVPSSRADFLDVMLHKLGYHPQSIKLIGRLLYFKQTDSEWSSFRKLWTEVLEKEGGAISVPWISSQSGDSSVAYMCLHDLPSRLKRCFSFCSLFPKDSTIHVPRLINIWIAQGCVKPSGSFQSIEAVGTQHFMQLASRSFFIDVVECDGNIVSCRIPGLLYDMARKLYGERYVFSSATHIPRLEKALHAAFYVDPTIQWEVPLFVKARKLRSFLLLNETKIRLGVVEPGCRLSYQQIHLIASNLPMLKMLDLHSSDISRVPSSVCKLKFLTYLDLSENKKIKVLPESITRLLLLQTLKLDNCPRLVQLPKDTKMLVSLVHLGVENCSSLTHTPRGIGRLTSLSTLSRFVLPIDRSIFKYSASLGELQYLSNLRGILRIYNLPHSKGAMSEFRAANLQAKKDLVLLRLEWSDGDEDHNDHDYDALELGDDKMAMQALEPHTNLQTLELRGYRGAEFPNWLSSLTNLVALALESCEMCRWLPPLHQLIHLESLTVEGLIALEYVQDVEIKGGGNSKHFFPSLEKLVLSNCPELEGWWKSKAPTTSPEMELPCFSRVSHLSIMACPKLNTNLMPTFPSLNSVKFSDSSMAILEQILVQPMSAASASTSSSSATLPLSHLEALDIEAISDIESFPEDVFQNLKSLKTFRVSRCRRLKALFQAICHLMSLTTLSIEACPKLDPCSGDDGTRRPVLENLHSVTFDRLPELVSLPRWIQHLPLLKSLEISGCHNLQSFPEWMTKRELRLLIIYWCPQLTAKCQRDVGEDWQKIKHIPGIIVNRKAV